MKKESFVTPYRIFLAIVFLGVWAWSGVSPSSHTVWILESILVVIFVPLILYWGKKVNISNVSLTLVAIFLMLHLIGAHYSYENVPFGEWLRDLLNTERTLYDQFVHFTFGLLLVYPIKEAFVKVTKIKGFWAYLIPLSFVFSLGALYEIVEWAVVNSVASSEAALEFLASQGDIWDAQKDMALALVGGMITLIINFAIVHSKKLKHKDN